MVIKSKSINCQRQSTTDYSILRANKQNIYLPVGRSASYKGATEVHAKYCHPEKHGQTCKVTLNNQVSNNNIIGQIIGQSPAITSDITFPPYRVTEDKTRHRGLGTDVVHSEEVGGDKDSADNIAQHDLAVGVAELGDGDVDDEGDGEEHQADHPEPGEHQLEQAVAVVVIVVADLLLLHHEPRVTLQHQQLGARLGYVDTVLTRLFVTFINIRKYG